MQASKMNVVNRHGQSEPVSFDRILNRINFLTLMEPKLDMVQSTVIAQKVIAQLAPGIQTTKLDEIAAEISYYKSTIHPQYGTLAGRIIISNLQKNTMNSFADTMNCPGLVGNVFATEFSKFCLENRDVLDPMVKYDRDYKFSYFGFKTLERSYLNKVNGKLAERPQHMLMRVAVGLFYKRTDISLKEKLENIEETYEFTSQFLFTHATPTLFSAGCRRFNGVSCFLVSMQSDSIDGIYKTLHQEALIQQSAGGVATHIHKIRPRGATIKTSNREGAGLVPMLKVYEATSMYVDQGRRRPGSNAMYLTPLHADTPDFVQLRMETGEESKRVTKLFYALWMPAIFMEAVRNNEEWYMFNPDTDPWIYTTYGEEQAKIYREKVSIGAYFSHISAQELWNLITTSENETGLPYLLSADECNSKNNLAHLGTLTGSNLCAEITLPCDSEHTAVCVLSSTKISNFLNADLTFNWDLLRRVTRRQVINLNSLIDCNDYPVPEAKAGAMRDRPLGIGLQDLASLFMKLRLPFNSPQARKLYRDINESIYYYALEASIELAERDGPFPSFEGSGFSKGIFQFDMWTGENGKIKAVVDDSRHDWTSLKVRAKKGVRNGTLRALMPTASTAQIMDSYESVEWITSNIFSRRTVAGEFTNINEYLIYDLIKLGKWIIITNKDGEITVPIKDKIVAANGSIQGLEDIPAEIKELYTTIYEYGMRKYIDTYAEALPFLDMTASMNLYFKEPTYSKLSSAYFYAFDKGVKTISYYSRSEAAVDAIKFTVPVNKKEGCGEACSS